ncbi:MAG TPA: MFS transporter [Chloroflexi bacterium]|nr:MFS transporter [Chloroflexota bacterium]
MQPTKPDSTLTFRRLIGTSMAAKLLIDIGAQIFNPFLPVIAAGLGMSVVELGQLVGLRSAMGIFAPVSGALSDRHGYRIVIRSALLLSAAGLLFIGVSNAPWLVVLGMILSGLGMSAFVPNLQAFISSRLAYNLRARGLGMIEYSWALTGIFGLSAVGLLMAATGWRTPFFMLAAGMVMMSFVFGAMPGIQRSRPALAAPGAARPSWRARVAAVVVVDSNRRSTYATILAGALSYFAAMQVMIAHGAWLADQYGLEAAALGAVAFVLGWFDLAASVSVSLFTDRIGKKRSVLIGIIGSLLGYLLMPALNVGVVAAVLIIGVARGFFEFNIVSHFPLLSEQAPAQRGQVMTLGAAVSLVGATVAGFTGPWLLVNYGVPALAWSSAGIVTVSLLTVYFLVQERPETH